VLEAPNAFYLLKRLSELITLKIKWWKTKYFINVKKIIGIIKNIILLKTLECINLKNKNDQ